jgi:sporulation protein YlmC with PRC-barrel domain
MQQRPTTGRNVPGTTDGLNNRSVGQLAHLSDMDDFEIADGEPDINGWDVRTTDGRKLGEVDDLLVDTALMKVRYIEVDVDDDFTDGEVRDVDDEARSYMLIPIGAARLDDDDDNVIVNIESTRVARLPRYDRGNLSREYEESLLTGFGRSPGAMVSTGDFYDGDYFNEHRVFEDRRRRAGTLRDDPSYLRRTVQ